MQHLVLLALLLIHAHATLVATTTAVVTVDVVKSVAGGSSGKTKIAVTSAILVINATNATIVVTNKSS